MQTIIKIVDENCIDEKIMEEAGELLKSGALVAFPTETVYGLGANALDEKAAAKIYAAKGRPSDNPLIIHIADMESLGLITEEIPKAAYMLAEKFWPGPLTMVMKKSDVVPYGTTGGLDTVAVRMPSHPIALEMIRHGGGYIAAPSANTSGRPSPTLASHVADDMDGIIPMILDGGAVGIGIESTIVDLTEEIPTILRPGFITKEMLEEVVGEVQIDKGLSADAKVPPKAPGMKYRHYAPNAKVTLVQGDQADFLHYMEQHTGKGVLALVFDADVSACQANGILCKAYGDTDEARAAAFFAALRDADAAGVQHLYVRAPRTDGVGLAVYNRLIRAAGYDIVHAEAE